jgi:hypothetical protein
MPKILRVRAAQDEKEERWVRKLAVSRHGPADWIVHARIVARSWDAALRRCAAAYIALMPRGSKDWEIGLNRDVAVD